MKMQQKHTRYHMFVLLLTGVLLLVSACATPQKIVMTEEQQLLQQQYLNAVKDAEIAEPHEISKELIAIVESNNSLVWHGDPGNRRVLVMTWTSWDGYDEQIGQEVEVGVDVWVTTVPELQNFCSGTEFSPEQLTLRLEQVLGLPPEDGKTRFVELWVSPNDLFRPSPDPEVTDHEAELNFPGSSRFLSISNDYIAWFNELKRKSYGENGYPWTRLGYTYDWNTQTGNIGMSEFVIQKGATVLVNAVAHLEEYCQ